MLKNLFFNLYRVITYAAIELVRIVNIIFTTVINNVLKNIRGKSVIDQAFAKFSQCIFLGKESMLVICEGSFNAMCSYPSIWY
uniref:hypothetical protein n=1 Tax=Pediococcus damnosus TaxID=51663 RepID=UPI0020A26157